MMKENNPNPNSIIEELDRTNKIDMKTIKSQDSQLATLDNLNKCILSAVGLAIEGGLDLSDCIMVLRTIASDHEYELRKNINHG